MGEKKRREKAGGGAGLQREMPILEGWPDRVIERIVETANQTMEDARATGTAHPQWIVDQLNDAEVIFGTFPDNEEGDPHVAVLRGIGEILPVIRGERDAPRAFYLRCWSRLDAEGYWQGFGDGRTKQGRPTINDIPPVRMVFMNDMPVDDRHIAYEAAFHDRLASLGADIDGEAWLTDAFQADLVVGVWEGAAFAGGIGVGLLKGVDLMKRALESRQPTTVTQVHIHCLHVGHAETLCRERGDGRVPGSFTPGPAGTSAALKVRARRYAVEIMPTDQSQFSSEWGKDVPAVLSGKPRLLNDDARA